MTLSTLSPARMVQHGDVMPNHNYPQAIDEVMSPPATFKVGTIEAVRQFARSKPWRGTEEERKAKFKALHDELCRIYGKHTTLTFGVLDGGCSGLSHYAVLLDEIVLVGKLSVVTYLHEFAHCLGRDERGAVRWSVSLFRRCFPRSFARCVASRHMLRRGSGGPETSSPG